MGRVAARQRRRPRSEFAMSLDLIAGNEPIAGYTLVRRLGRGGFGEVWEATAPGGVQVALKFVRLDTNEGDLEQRALEVIRNIRHPHLLDVQFAARVDDCLVLAMPLCDRSLMQRLSDCRAAGAQGIPRDEMLGYMRDLARAVDFLNGPLDEKAGGGRLGVQHRDIKPHNIFLVGGSVRLADFGLAKVLEATQASHSGAMSPNYAAPEVISGRVSPWSDQYSLAVAYAQLRTGRLPFTGDSVHHVLHCHLHEPPDLSALPPRERAAVARALSKRPEDRWPTCRAFALALEAAAHAEDEALASMDPTPARPVGSGEIGRSTHPNTSIHMTEPATVTQSMVATPARPFVPAPATATPGRSMVRVVAAGVVILMVAAAAMSLIPRSRNGVPESNGKDPSAGLPPPAAKAPADEPPKTAKPPDEPQPPREPKVREVAIKSTEPEPAKARERSAEPADPEPAAAKPHAAKTAANANPNLANEAHAVLTKYCYQCHGSSFKAPRLNVLDRDILVAAPPAAKKKKGAYIVPGKPDESFLWKRVGIEEDMPPEDPVPSDEEKATLKRWIEAGAPFPVLEKARDSVTEKTVLTAIRDHLQQTPDVDRRFMRYFTFHNLHNNRNVLDHHLRLYRAALAKLVNSLSWEHSIVVPRALPNTSDAVFVVDVRDLGWDANDLWQAMVRREEPPAGTKFLGARDELRKGYPYGLAHDRLPNDQAMQQLALDVRRLADSELPYLRADWFIATASRPPLYEAILGLPKNAAELEKQLRVDVRSNFLRDRLARAAFATSGVSQHNRMVERHAASNGVYWKSYDFKNDEGTGELARFPLGPVFTDNPFSRQAFEHAGGEIIFSLPNGLHGYLLVNSSDERIEAGPIEIVGDSLQTIGSSTIVNGLSCMACHKAGMISDFEDTIRTGNALSGEARQKVERLYSTKAAMDKLLEEDQDAYLAALEKTTGSFLKAGGDENKPIRDFPEPIGAIAKLYVKDLGLEEVAAELGIEAGALKERIAGNPRLRQLGLGPLLQPGGKIKRATWESLQFFNSPFQEAALQMELGTPYHKL